MEESKCCFEIINGVGIIPDGTKKNPKNAFRKCGDWVKIDIPEGVTSIDEYAFYMCENLKEVTLPSTLKYIDAGAFGHCTSIKKIVLPVELKGIGYYAFYRNRFDSITCRPENPKSVNRFSYTHTDEYNSDIANSRVLLFLSSFLWRCFLRTDL